MQTIGRYEVVRPLGRGGMGQVFLARDPKLERSVALKLLKHETDSPEARVLFEREAKALAALSHPNIITIFEIAEHDQRQFIAMEYLPGKSLRELLLYDKPSRERLVAICADVATALEAAHATGILHRDIKPENVVVGDTGVVKVVDFGLARRLGRPSIRDLKSKQAIARRATELVDAFMQTAPAAIETVQTTQAVHAVATEPVATHSVFGTPAYMAPEVLMGEPSSPASDVYGLGVMLYECLTGRRPYNAPELHTLIALVIDGEGHPTRFDDPLGELVEQMLSRDPTMRPTPAAIAKRLARPATVSQPRRRGWLLPAVAVLAIGGGFALWRGASDERQSDAVVDRGTLAIQLAIAVPSYGAQSPSALAYTTVLTMLLDGTSIKISPVSQHHDVLARVNVVEQRGRARANVELVDVQTKAVETIGVDGRIDELAKLMEATADAIAKAVKPSSAPDRASGRPRAQKYFDAAKNLSDMSVDARPYLEQAVLIDPAYEEAWNRFATVLVMSIAGDEVTRRAFDRVVALVPEGPRKHIRRAALLRTIDDYAGMLAELVPLESAQLSPDDRRDLLYQIGEAHWHDGRHTTGVKYFKSALDVDPKFVLAASHLGEYAIARRDEVMGREYLRQQQEPTDFIEFAAGKYEKLAVSGRAPFKRWSLLVLDRPAPDDDRDNDAGRMETIGLAAGRGDLDVVRRELATMLAEYEHIQVTGRVTNNLVLMSEVVMILGLVEESRRLVEFFRVHSARYNYKRLAILAAPMLGKPAFARSQLTERLAMLQTALEAELAGDRATAAKLLDELIRNPTFEWDYVERMALLRNLRALGRKREAELLCADTIRPAVMRSAFHVARRICREK